MEDRKINKKPKIDWAKLLKKMLTETKPITQAQFEAEIDRITLQIIKNNVVRT